MVKPARFFILFILLLASVLGAAQQSPMSDEQWIESQYYPSVMLVYSQDEMGNMKFTCTATVIHEQDGVFSNTYHAVTAAHCAASDDKDGKAKQERAFFYLTADESAEKKFLKAKVLGIGSQTAGDDFAVFEFKTRDKIPVMKLGTDPKSVAGEPIVNISVPLGVGKQVFTGRVSAPRIERPIEEGSISWTGAMFVQMPGITGGSSGSSVVCAKQRAICGFIVGTVGQTQTVAIPASRFLKFYDGVKAKNYTPDLSMENK